MSLLQHARQEIQILNTQTPDNVLRHFTAEILALVKTFSQVADSGGSAPFYAKALSDSLYKLLSYKTIAPITDEKGEWIIHEESDFSQNKRLSALFKGQDNKAYYLDAIVFQGEDDGDTFTGTVQGISSRQYVKFPFKPKTFYIDVFRVPYDKEVHSENEAIQLGDDSLVVYQIKDRSQLDKVFEYYDRYEGNKKT